MPDLFTDIQYLKGVGEKRAELLKKKGIDTIGALLSFYPRAYLDWREITPVAECPFYENRVIKAKIVTAVQEHRIRREMVLYKFLAEDESGQVMVTLFNQKYLAERLHTGSEYLFYGRVGGNYSLRELSSPRVSEADATVIEPIYPAIGKLNSAAIGRLMKNALPLCAGLVGALPEETVERNQLCGFSDAVRNIHFPKTPEQLEKAKRRLVFEELFVLQTGLSLLKSSHRGKAGFRIERPELEEFKAHLSFALTGAQERVIGECLADMSSGRPMNRLVQGDVGSGKTAVAAALCFVSAKNGFQSAFMAPTEILAEQHYDTMLALTEGSGIRCALLTGSLSRKKKNEIKEEIAGGNVDVIVGTHALLSDDVVFGKLGLVITDEQHRFGVEQRGKLSDKGNNPHTLVMSATPIPRTLGLIIYGDLDISIMDEYPKGRQKIHTYAVDSSYQTRIYNYIKKALDEGRQGYIVCPLVEENEELPLKSAQEYYEELREGEFANYSIGLLHGKMPAKEKDAVMRRFAAGEIQLLIATTVIEVGIDVPNAVIMVIENAERFGLSQLHQLRGRIGRGVYRSDCILISDAEGDETKKRLQVIEKTNDGFKIADEDLKLRGPGDFLGNRQHGLPQLKIADLFADRTILHAAGREAEHVLRQDPALKKAQNQSLRRAIEELYVKLNQN